jgi:predicted nucleic acid-binding protein
MIILDASATAFALLDEGETGNQCRTALRADSQWLVPEQWLAEVLSVIRGNLLGGKITPDQATVAAAAEQYQCALITTDARLARANGVRCAVTVIS